MTLTNYLTQTLNLSSIQVEAIEQLAEICGMAPMFEVSIAALRNRATKSSAAPVDSRSALQKAEPSTKFVSKFKDQRDWDDPDMLDTVDSLRYSTKNVSAHTNSEEDFSDDFPDLPDVDKKFRNEDEFENFLKADAHIGDNVYGGEDDTPDAVGDMNDLVKKLCSFLNTSKEKRNSYLKNMIDDAEGFTLAIQGLFRGVVKFLSGNSDVSRLKKDKVKLLDEIKTGISDFITKFHDDEDYFQWAEELAALFPELDPSNLETFNRTANENDWSDEETNAFIANHQADAARRPSDISFDDVLGGASGEAKYYNPFKSAAKRVLTTKFNGDRQLNGSDY